MKRRKVSPPANVFEKPPLEKQDGEILVKAVRARQERSLDPFVTLSEKQPVQMQGPSSTGGTFSRGKQMVALATKVATSECSAPNKFRVPRAANSATGRVQKFNERLLGRKQAPNPGFSQNPWKAREIDRTLIAKTCDDPIGSGTYGDCFLAEYRGIKVVIKEMKRRDKSIKESERCKKEVIHEANVLNSLGDNEGLPLLLGVCTETELYSLVIQFYGRGEESLTLHKAIKVKMLTKTSTVDTFVRICNTLEFIHTKGYLHNDLKTNNVLLERGIDGFCPIIIDFGKSRPIAKSVQSGQRRLSSADYIAPEVGNGLKETTASDVYSLGKMLDRAVYRRSFELLFARIIRKTTNPSHLERPSVGEIINQLKKLL